MTKKSMSKDEYFALYGDLPQSDEALNRLHPDLPIDQWPTHRLHVKNQYNAFMFPRYDERNTQPSETVPNQSLSLKTLLDRYAKGLPLSGNNSEPAYYGDEEMPDLSKMDISEIHDLKKAVAADIAKFRAHETEQQKAAAQAAHEKHINDEVEKRVKSKKSEPIPGIEPKQ